MDPRIEALIKLQLVASEEDHLRRELAEIPDRRKHLEDDFARAETAVKAHHDELKQLQAAVHSKETDIRGLEDDIAKKQTQLLQIKTNEAYTAMLHEIERARKKISDLETEILNWMDQIEEKRQEVASEEEHLSRRRATHDRDIRDLETLLKDAREKMSTVQSRKDAILRDCDERHVKIFDRLHGGKEDGKALVPVVDDNCGGCHMRIPPQVVADAKWGQSIVRCNNCGRILYWLDEETAAALGV